MEAEFADKLYERLLKKFLDVIIMLKIAEAEYSGYDLLSYFHKTFDIMVSPGTLYSTLYSMEREGYVKAREDDAKRVYSLTSKGGMAIESMKSGTSLGDFFLPLLRSKLRKIKEPSECDRLPTIDALLNPIQE